MTMDLTLREYGFEVEARAPKVEDIAVAEDIIKFMTEIFGGSQRVSTTQLIFALHPLCVFVTIECGKLHDCGKTTAEWKSNEIFKVTTAPMASLGNNIDTLFAGTQGYNRAKMIALIKKHLRSMMNEVVDQRRDLDQMIGAYEKVLA